MIVLIAIFVIVVVLLAKSGNQSVKSHLEAGSKSFKTLANETRNTAATTYQTYRTEHRQHLVNQIASDPELLREAQERRAYLDSLPAPAPEQQNVAA